MKRFNSIVGVVLGLLLTAAMAQGATPGTLTFSASNTTGDGTVTPVLSWSTAPAAAACTAGGDWSGAKAPTGGTETLAPITSSKTYNLTCTWNDTVVKLSWIPSSKNVDGTPYTDPKSQKMYQGSGSACTNLTVQQTIPNNTTNTVTITPPSVGTWCFSVTAVNQRDVESAKSNTSTKTTGTASGTQSVGITVNPQPAPATNLVAE